MGSRFGITRSGQNPECFTAFTFPSGRTRNFRLICTWNPRASPIRRRAPGGSSGEHEHDNHMSAEIHGTWKWTKHLDKSGTEDPRYQAPGTYTFNPDGSGSFDVAGKISLPMKWKIVDGRLQFGGARGVKGQSTVSFETPDPSLLVFIDKYGHRDFFSRVDDAEG